MGNLNNRTLKEYIDKIDDMLLDESYSFAENTLKGMMKVIKEHGHITPGQQVSVDDILKSKPESPTYKEWWT